MNRRGFLHALGAAATCGLPLLSGGSGARAASNMMYESSAFGNVSLLHLADLHGQLVPGHFREAEVHIGIGQSASKGPYLVGERFLERHRVIPGSRMAHALTHLQFEDAAAIYGRMGGVAHLASLIGQLRAQRPDALLLDSGDTWLGSALSFHTQGREMVEFSRSLQVDAMTGDWEFALGEERLRGILAKELGPTAFLAQNVSVEGKAERGAIAGIRPYSIFFTNGVGVAVIGLACPQIGRSEARDFGLPWRFTLDEAELQRTVNAARGKGARVVVLLSHAGLSADVKLAGHIRGIDVILGGHSHDITLRPVIVSRFGGQTIVVSGGSSGKFIGVLDLQVDEGRVRDYRYAAMPVFSNLIPPDADVVDQIERARAPYEKHLGEVLARTEGILFRRDNFGSTFDQVIADALRASTGADVVLSPGFRWGQALLPGDAITMEYVQDHLAVPHGQVRVEHLTGAELHERMERWCDHVFNPDPYLQTGEDMVRSPGLNYLCEPGEVEGARLSDLRLGGTLIDAAKKYRVASWGLGNAPPDAPQAWQVVADYLRQLGTLPVQVASRPGLIGMARNHGVN